MGQNDEPTRQPCPHCGQTTIVQTIISPVPLGDPYSFGRYTVPDDFKGLLHRIKEKNPGSNINV
jgi:hypothetical protein